VLSRLVFGKTSKGMSKATGYEPSPSQRHSMGNFDAPLMIAAIEKISLRESDEDLRECMQITAKTYCMPIPRKSISLFEHH
jgi:hypothetical protein